MKRIYILCVVIFSLTIVAVQKAPVKLPKSFKKSFAFVPSGNVLLNSDTSSVQAFFIQKTEVSNAEYRTFLSALKEAGELEKLAIAKTDSANWNNEFEADLSPMQNMYHWHPAYDDYPVVNISQAAAKLYCDWLTNEINTQSKNLKVQVRLPFHAEVVRAGVAENLDAPYPWGGPYLRNKKGCFLLNYNPKEEGDTTTRMSDDGGFHQVKVDSYLPNELGIYNLCGNVSEMINEENTAVGGSWNDKSDGVMLRSKKTFESVSATVGFRPVFTYVAK